ncbi:MAG: antibiotic biosynthesis monooxygenase [Acidobacteriia bacterium]|nr:antibiotic biosynthesis monooxygenase [Terriglobia bacterium]
MFARVLEFTPKLEKKDELVKTIKNEVLPILKKQPGFLEMLPLFPEIKNEKVITISLWMDRKDIERYERDTFTKVEQIVKPHINTPMVVRMYEVETTLCQHFVDALAA